MKSRKESFEAINNQPDVSVLIIGAGINGIGVFRDLALQGVDVLLVDRGDFCSGASMASSHMLHGGIRYLENGEFRLVREALKERNRLLRNAPHLTKSLATTIPIYKRFSGLFKAPLKFLRLQNKPGERGAAVIKIGLLLYDFFVRSDSSMPGHRFRSKGESHEMWPSLNRDVISTATYYDGAMPSPERICIELVADAEQDNPDSKALNYLSVAGADRTSIQLRDEISGNIIKVCPKIVINAAGPWIDEVNNTLGRDSGFIGGTKGSHIILGHPELRAALGENEFFFEYYDGRIVLIYPYEDKVLIGTTDIRIDHADKARCTENEIEYMLDMVNYVFPEIKVSNEDIIFKFSGVRPLPASDADATGQISRDHSIRFFEADEHISFPILSLIGGKWTTYRAFAEQVSDEVLDRLGLFRERSTANLAIGGGRDYPLTDGVKKDWIHDVGQRTGLELNRMEILFGRYGTKAASLAQYLAQENDVPLTNLPAYSGREVEFITENEHVLHIDDLILRRSLIAWMGDTTIDLLYELSELIGGVLGWDTLEKHMEINRAVELLNDKHGLNLV